MKAYPIYSCEESDAIKAIISPGRRNILMVEIGPRSGAALDLTMSASVAKRLIAVLAEQLALMPPAEDTLDGHPTLIDYETMPNGSVAVVA